VYTCNGSRDSSVSKVTGLSAGHPKIRSSILGRGKEFFASPKCPKRLWSPPSLPFSSCLEPHLGCKTAEAWSWHSPPTPHGPVRPAEGHLHFTDCECVGIYNYDVQIFIQTLFWCFSESATNDKHFTRHIKLTLHSPLTDFPSQQYTANVRITQHRGAFA
jgi:hypothetical protein